MDFQGTRISVIIPTVNAYQELDLAITSLKKNSDCEIEFVIVVDPDQTTGKIDKNVLDVCKKHKLKSWINSSNLGPYGNWNRGAEIATTDWLVFATDDQYFAPHWDRNLLKSWRPKRLVAGQLVEPGIIPVYKTNIQKEFGTIPSEFDEQAFLTWCEQRSESGFVDGGFFIPLLQSRQDFNELGHYPDGGQFGTSSAKSNDYLYIQSAIKRGYTFGTALDSYSYHFQASSWKKKTLTPMIAAIILTHNEEIDLEKCLKSLSWTDENFVIDSSSTDRTLSIAKKMGAKVFDHKFLDFATQRNFGLSKVQSFDWVLMIDADEVVEPELALELKSFAKDIYLDGVNLPRKNYIFGKWIEHTDWYPDHRLVFFRPKLVEYVGEVHERATFIKGNGSLATAKSHLIHHNYDTVKEFIVKNMIDYPQSYAKSLADSGKQFYPVDLLTKPISEFMRRYFLCAGYKDGLHGLILSLLMAMQTMVAYAYIWEIKGKKEDLSMSELKTLFAELKNKGSELSFWLATIAVDNSRGATKLIQRAKRKALKLIKGL